MTSTPVDNDDVIVLSGLTKLYEPTPNWMRIFARSHLAEPVKALDGIDLTVRAGEICAIVGPNGAGKTTLFRILVGLTTSTGGTATVLGLDAERDSEQVRQVVGWMPSEDRSLLMRATCKENLQLHGRLQGMPRQELAERIPYVLETVNLTPQTESVVAGLSAGMRARLRLARAMLPGPRALILDEPTGAVDPIAAHGLLTLIMDLVKQERLAVLISSHRLEEIEALQSHALLMDRGRVKYSGDLDSLRREWDRPVVEFVLDSPATAYAVADLLPGAAVDDTSVRVPLAGDEPVGVLLTRLGPLAASIRHVREHPMPLRDLIARVYERGTVA
ncbi:ABC transporter ATP-binding protein [Actinoplanes sp. G11-F43]|uniref:ABC transporter ATP-binding protein n=1 Tax=Actinoplanes sp. G11-F43 TaxID=3424130 RepID=UPI003D3459F5